MIKSSHHIPNNFFRGKISQCFAPDKIYQIVQSGKPLRKRKAQYNRLPSKIACWVLKNQYFILDKYYYKVNCTEPFPSVSIPWYNIWEKGVGLYPHSLAMRKTLLTNIKTLLHKISHNKRSSLLRVTLGDGENKF